MKAGKRVIVHQNAPLRSGYVVIVDWKPKPVEAMNMPGRGWVRVFDPTTFALGALLKLEDLLTGQPEKTDGESWTMEELVDALHVVGCEVQIELTTQPTGGVN